MHTSVPGVAVVRCLSVGATFLNGTPSWPSWSTRGSRRSTAPSSACQQAAGGHVLYDPGTSTIIMGEEVGLGLGAQAGEARLRAVATEAGFTGFRRATYTPFNLVPEARP